MSKLININEADVATLTEISGIGEALAARIVEYRETVHPFEEVIELTAVPGISERMVRAFAELVTVEQQSEEGNEVVETAVSSPPEPAEPEETEPATNISTEDVPEEVEENIESEPITERMEAHALIDEEMEENGDSGSDSNSAVESEPVAVELPHAETTAETQPDFLFREESEPTMTAEPTATAASETPPASTAGNVSQRRGCIFIIIGAVAGAILGMALTLALLAALNNGSLQYAQSNARLQNQLESVTNSLDALNQELESANQNLEAVATRAGTLADDQSVMNEALTGVESTLGNAQEGLTTAQDNIDELMATAVTLDKRIDTISESAETFDTFLTGMRDLLVDLQGMPIPTITPYATITPKADDVTVTAVPKGTETAVTPTPSPTRIPTRTPRPTSTPISLPTSTPAQQP